MQACRIRGAELTGTMLQEAIDAGSGENYFPVIAKHIDGLAASVIPGWSRRTSLRCAIAHRRIQISR